MKTLIAFSAACLTLGALAVTEVENPGSMLGLTIIDSTDTMVPIALKYDASATAAEKRMSVAEVIQTSTLPAGVKDDVRIYAFNHDEQKYDRFQLLTSEDGETKYWWWIDHDSDNGEKAASTYLDKGYAFWLIRPEAIAKTTKVYVIGQLASTAKVAVLGGVKAVHTLLSNPSESALDLLADDNVFVGKAAVGDQIHIPQAGGAKKIYQYAATGWYSTQKKKYSVSPIASGEEFWYVRKAGCGSFDVTWDL